MIKLRFRDFPGEKSYGHFIELVEMVTTDTVKVYQNPSAKVDLEITGPYGGNFDDYKTPFFRKLKRFGYASFTSGRHLTKKNLATGVQPRKSAAKSIWYSGENVAPPQGTWDGYLSFDTFLANDVSVYLPLWYLTSTDLFKSTTESYWGGSVPKVRELLTGRELTIKRKKFVVAFIGKSYPLRLHAIEAISKIGRIDVFGESARNVIKSPSKVAKNYKFIMCFENDLFPGYVTEKPIEAYSSGAIPLYWGHDALGYLNPNAIINLNEFTSIREWTEHISRVMSDFNLYKRIYEQPILIKEPSLNPAISLLRKVLEIDS